MITTEEKLWIDNIWQKINTKMEKVAVRSYDKLPYTTIDGVHDDRKEKQVNWWTNGFWGGLMWLLYADTRTDVFKTTAEHTEELLDKAFEKFEVLHHDVGFLWHITSGADYKLTGNRKSFLRAIYAANILAGRFVVKGNFIRAWNAERSNYSIIDTMMNLNLLYWASDVTGDSRFRNIAMTHADMAMQYHIRPDGSVVHIVEHDPETGEVVANLAGQGMSENSSWSRGQAWALYGFILSYIHTGKKEYLDTAKKVAHYFIAAVCNDYLPRCDFRSPEEPIYYDSTAGAIAACGLIELSRHVSEFEGKMYYNAAINLLKNMEQKFCNWDDAEDAILMMGTEDYNGGRKNISIIYGDYYFIEALYKLRNNELLFW